MSRNRFPSNHSEISRCRESAVLQHAHRYRIVLPEALHASNKQLFPTCKAAMRTCNIINTKKLLCHGTLFWKKKYYFLSASGWRRVGGAPVEQCEKPFTESAKIHALAFVGFCCLQGEHRTRLTREEIRKHFRDLYRPGLPANYYVDASSQPPRIGFVRVDRGGRGRWDRIIAKALDDIESHWLQPGFRRLIEGGRFEIRIITSLPQKANRIRIALDEQISRRKVAIQVSAVPELVNLIQPPSVTKSKT